MAVDLFGNSGASVGLEIEVLASVLTPGDRSARRRYPRCGFDRFAADGPARGGVTEQPLDDVLWERLIMATLANR